MRTRIAVFIFALIIVALPYAWGKVEHLVPALVFSAAALAGQIALAPRFLNHAEKKESDPAFRLLFYLAVIMIGHAAIIANL